ncbi:hypothetical protein [Pseudalkalibacillus caeni]|uniref:Uncharacterized protein n=1 Tax=Exobacillus caeni TaxID=2574798 RepID=A0A5R9FBC0_9BACL|nr:hypothetical protein [Pseudalkalibacillus caeni]TLS38978.1 hypothetical protein FCL54_01315 [Pseudalkalibacillus caeni]
MILNREDLAVIQQALNEMVQNKTDSQNMQHCQELLNKLNRTEKNTNPMMNFDVESFMNDGFRYDYDDSSDLY